VDAVGVLPWRHPKTEIFRLMKGIYMVQHVLRLRTIAEGMSWGSASGALFGGCFAVGGNIGSAAGRFAVGAIYGAIPGVLVGALVGTGVATALSWLVWNGGAGTTATVGRGQVMLTAAAAAAVSTLAPWAVYIAVPAGAESLDLGLAAVIGAMTLAATAVAGVRSPHFVSQLGRDDDAGVRSGAAVR
jgi:hypothetical protein